MHKNANAKYSAAKHDLNRLRLIYADTGGRISNIDAQQAFLQFCSDIYSLHDWLAKEFLIKEEVWKLFLLKTDSLFLVAKIETMNKHAGADHAFWRSRYQDIKFNNHAVLIPPQGPLKHWATQGKYLITVDGTQLDSLHLAEDALRELDRFFSITIFR